MNINTANNTVPYTWMNPYIYLTIVCGVCVCVFLIGLSMLTRLNGSYEALKGGSTIEAMEDFTGGVGEMYEVKKTPENFFEVLQKALKRGSMVGCSIDVSKIMKLHLRLGLALCPEMQDYLFCCSR